MTKLTFPESLMVDLWEPLTLADLQQLTTEWCKLVDFQVPNMAEFWHPSDTIASGIAALADVLRPLTSTIKRLHLRHVPLRSHGGSGDSWHQVKIPKHLGRRVSSTKSQLRREKVCLFTGLYLWTK